MRPMTLHEALLYGQGTERAFLCPVHGDSRPSASLNIVKQVWYCYTCGAKGGLTGEDALIEPDYEVMKNWFTQKMEEGRVYPESWLARWDAGPVHPYWNSRVGEAAARHFRLGGDPETGSATYPLRDQTGRVLGVVRRALHGDGPKYLYPRGVDIGRLLFNYNPAHLRAVLLVEGAIDAIACWNVGVEAFAIYGSRLSTEQVQLIDRVDPDIVYTAFDADAAGRAAGEQVQRAFRHRLVGELTWPSAWGKDVDEIGPENLRKVLTDLVPAGLECVESTTCRSDESTRTPTPQQTLSFRSTSTPRRMQIVRDLAS